MMSINLQHIKSNRNAGLRLLVTVSWGYQDELAAVAQ